MDPRKRIHYLITFSEYENENGGCHPSRCCERKGTLFRYL